ncbi:MAG: ABC transporter permease [Muribaculaceae bacterium]|nr:ABC transporter permease [Muribaculaceae bacterium]
MTASSQLLLRRLLRANLSPWRIVGFIVSNLLGLAIICAGVQIYADLRGLLHSEGSVVDTGYLVLNKRVTASTMLGDSSSDFTTDEIADLEAQPWVRGVGRFTASGYEVRAGIEQGGRGMSTMLFFESVPDRFVDVSAADWHYEPGDREVPIIIAKDYLTLYNFGFASGAGLPRVSEQVMSGLPISLRLNSNDGRQMQLTGRIVGYSDRLNTVLVPESFMNWSNEMLAPDASGQPTRLIVDVSSPGDVAIAPYLEAHGMEAAGDQSGSTASYLLKVCAGIVIGIGVVITLLSVFILLLSMSLLLEKNRPTIHSLLQLGYSFGEISAPYRLVVTIATVISMICAIGAVVLLRHAYRPALEALDTSGASILWSIAAAVVVSLLSLGVNIWSVRRRIHAAWR